ncbi:MAG: AMP-binding protein [Pseudomonadota bacterium]
MADNRAGASPASRPHDLRSTGGAADWGAARAAHRWDLPVRYNIAWDVCEKWARTDPERLALIYLRPDGGRRDYTYVQLSRAARRFANALEAHGIARGDRLGLLLPQMPETIIAHLACYMLGVIVVPVFTLFGDDGLAHRLGDAGVRAIVTDDRNLAKVNRLRDRLPDLAVVFSVDRPGDGAWGFWQELGKAREDLRVVETGPDDPAFISYTSGTTGPAKGALHGHRVLLGHMPGIEHTHQGFPQPGDLAWTPADWAWIGGLCNMALPALKQGVPLLAHRMEKFDPEYAFDLMARHGVRNAFIPPTALRMMRGVPDPARFGARLRSVGSGGESLGAETLAWGEAVLGVAIHEFYGQTECNLVIGNDARLAPIVPGAMGRAFPGSDVAVLGADGEEPLAPGQAGEIAVRAGDPAMFLGYWNQPQKTAAKFRGDWMLTGDEGVAEPGGLFRFAARTDDVITSAGYRIGPAEIENCLTGHPAVALAAVVGVPDPLRTEAVTAFVTLKPGARGGASLAEELTALVRSRVAAHCAPRAVHEIDAMPMTATGKIMRRALRERAGDSAPPHAGAQPDAQPEAPAGAKAGAKTGAKAGARAG